MIPLGEVPRGVKKCIETESMAGASGWGVSVQWGQGFSFTR